jgi:hypothetical protein
VVRGRVTKTLEVLRFKPLSKNCQWPCRLLLVTSCLLAASYSDSVELRIHRNIILTYESRGSGFALRGLKRWC